MLAGSLVLSPANVDANVALLSSAVDFKAAREALAGVLAETGAQPMPNAENLLRLSPPSPPGTALCSIGGSRLSASSSWWFLVDQFFGSDPNITGWLRSAHGKNQLARAKGAAS
jgi:hypothetical protein